MVLTVYWIGFFLKIEADGVSFLLFLRGICFWYSVTLAKVDPNPDKTERYKFSLEIITSEGSLFSLIG